MRKFLSKFVHPTIKFRLTMVSDFDYSTVPLGFFHCFNKGCKQAKTCLHYKVAQHATPDCKLINTFNPAHIASFDGECPYFKADQVERYALGMTHLLDKMPHILAISIKKQLITYFNRSTFYRCWRKERLITPAEQKYIQQIFLNKKIEESPVFDEYIEQYDW